jgi:Flp pilus assembly protein TadD
MSSLAAAAEPSPPPPHDGANVDPNALLNALGLRPGDLATGLDVANALMRAGNHGEALRTYAVLALCEPMNYRFQLALADCAAKLEQHHLAIQAAAVLIALAPQDPRGYFISGRACMSAGYAAEAREDLTMASELCRKGGDTGLGAEAARLLVFLDARGSAAGGSA